MRVRMRFAKRGDLRFIGHRDLMEALHRLLRRAGVRPAYSQGFHPKPKVSFPTALPLNVVGEDEVLEIEFPEEFASRIDAEEIRSTLQKHTIPGLDFLAAENIPTGVRKASVRAFAYRFHVPEDRVGALRQRIDWVNAQSSIAWERVGRARNVDIKDGLEHLALGDDGTLIFRLRANIPNASGPRDILAVLEIDDLETCGSVLVRTHVHIEEQE